MTNDEMQLLREFRSGISVPTEETRQRAYAYAISRSRGGLSLRLRNLATGRARVYVIATACILLVVGLSFAFIPQSSHTPRTGGSYATEGLTLVPDDGTFGSTVHVTVDAPVGNATLKLQVLREPSEPGTNPSTEASQVVYEEQVPMTEVTKGDNAMGDNPLSTWSGSLSTSDWSGGCQRGFIYSINATALDSTGDPAAILGGTGWRTCAG